MTRRLPLALAALAASLFCLFALAVPAVATEGAEQAAAASTDWSGVLLAVGVGFALAVAVFADASPGSIPRADAHH